MPTKMRGVLLAGGTGSRLYPLTRITNKHLLPIYDRPMIQHAIETLVDAGITEIRIILGDHHAGEFIRLLGAGEQFRANISYNYQDKAGGIAEALGLAEQFANDGPIVVMLADNIFENSIKPMVSAFRREPHGARILLSPSDDVEHLRHVGVPELDGDRVVNIVEKPRKPASNYGVTGVYCYEASVFDVIKTLKPSRRGELEITDVNNHYIAVDDMKYDVLDGFWGDAGESIDAYYAVNDFVRSKSVSCS